MKEPARVSPDEAHRKLKSDATLLVCAYDDEEKFRMMQLEGAISLGDFESRLPSLPKDREIIFYCA